MKRLVKYQTPILSDELFSKLDDAIAGYARRGLWKEWGLDKVREQGSAILFHGPPGVGKTITAYYIAKKLHLKLVELSLADYGSHVPGQLARNIKKIFGGEVTLAMQEKRNVPVIFLDECDAMLVSRNKLGPDMMWMLEPIDALLTEISKYPGLVLLATNQLGMLDEALERRLIAKVRFDRPDYGLRYKIWKAKWPEKFPVRPTNIELEELAESDLSGAEIENAFLLWAGSCMKHPELTPKVDQLIWFLKEKLSGYKEGRGGEREDWKVSLQDEV